MSYELKSARYLARDVLARAVEPGDAVPVRLRWPGGGNLELPVTLAAGKTTLLYVTRADWSFYSHAFVQP